MGRVSIGPPRPIRVWPKPVLDPAQQAHGWAGLGGVPIGLLMGPPFSVPRRGAGKKTETPTWTSAELRLSRA
jgi:hypothetical protein